MKVLTINYMLPKEFIKQVLIDEFKDIVERHKYISFSILCIGIEFLGKSIDLENDWDTSGLSKKHFNNAINELFDEKYKKINEQYKLADNLRNGLCHTLRPKYNVGLTHKNEALEYNNKHLEEKNGMIIIIIEDLYEDFKLACEIVLGREFDSSNKMNKEFLSVPKN